MTTVLMVILAVASVILVVSILMQPGNSAGLSGSIGGGAEQLFGKRKSQGYEGILEKISIVDSVIFIVLSIIIVMLENRA